MDSVQAPQQSHGQTARMIQVAAGVEGIKFQGTGKGPSRFETDHIARGKVQQVYPVDAPEGLAQGARSIIVPGWGNVVGPCLASRIQGTAPKNCDAGCCQ